MPTDPPIPKLTTAQVRVLEQLAGRECISRHPDFPGWHTDYGRVQDVTFRILRERGYIAASWSPDIFVITDPGRAALERAREATA